MAPTSRTCSTGSPRSRCWSSTTGCWIERLESGTNDAPAHMDRGRGVADRRADGGGGDQVVAGLEQPEKFGPAALHRFLIARLAALDDSHRRLVTVVRLVELAGLRVAERDPIADRVPSRQIGAGY